MIRYWENPNRQYAMSSESEIVIIVDSVTPIESTKLYKTSQSSTVLLVYPQTNSVLFMCIFPANNLLTVIYHQPNSLYLPLSFVKPALFLFS